MEEKRNNQFHISKKEITRRKKAFTVLESFFIVGIIISTCNILIEHPLFYTSGLVICITILIFLRYLLLKYFNNFSRQEIRLLKNNIEILTKHNQKKYIVSDLVKVMIIKTTRDKIRRIKFIYKNKILDINALDNFEIFKQDIFKIINRNIVKVRYEKIDYDHPLFYVFLGITFGLITPHLINFLSRIQQGIIKNISLIISFYIISLGFYFIYRKPIARNMPNNKPFADYCFGFTFILFGVGSVFYFIFIY
jgi:hypothetical protein